MDGGGERVEGELVMRRKVEGSSSDNQKTGSRPNKAEEHELYRANPRGLRLRPLADRRDEYDAVDADLGLN